MSAPSSAPVALPTMLTSAGRPSSERWPHGSNRAVHDLLALSSNTSRGLNHDAPSTSSIADATDVDYWYRLGLRNACAQAAGLLLARELEDDPFVIAERITRSLDAGVTDMTALRSAAYGYAAPTTSERRLHWMGPKEFTARHGVVSCADRDFGARWGARGEQRITLRPNPLGGKGLLFAYDPVWDEFAVLVSDVTPAAVEAAFRHASDIDIHLDPVRFAELVQEHETKMRPTDSPAAIPGDDLGVQL